MRKTLGALVVQVTKGPRKGYLTHSYTSIYRKPVRQIQPKNAFDEKLAHLSYKFYRYESVDIRLLKPNVCTKFIRGSKTDPQGSDKRQLAVP